MWGGSARGPETRKGRGGEDGSGAALCSVWASAGLPGETWGRSSSTAALGCAARAVAAPTLCWRPLLAGHEGPPAIWKTSPPREGEGELPVPWAAPCSGQDSPGGGAGHGLHLGANTSSSGKSPQQVLWQSQQPSPTATPDAAAHRGCHRPVGAEGHKDLLLSGRPRPGAALVSESEQARPPGSQSGFLPARARGPTTQLCLPPSP